jgi:delta-aminolevulinic acid dehydratase/porphobilinogen synthase
MTSGGAVVLFGVVVVDGGGGFPNNITVPPDNTLLTRAIPTGGNCNTLEVTAGVDVVVPTDGVDGVVAEIFIEEMTAAALEGVVVMLSNAFFFFFFN